MDTLADIFNPWPSQVMNLTTSMEVSGGIGRYRRQCLIVRSRQAIALLRQRLDNLESALARRGLRLTVAHCTRSRRLWCG